MNDVILSKIDMKHLQEVELELLKVFILTCNKLNLKYYVIGGTLLGAVRHQGFIPWDDDIDVGMPRKDYEKWLKKAPELLRDTKYFVQYYRSDRDYLGNSAKLRNNQTTFIETSSRKLRINHGIYIDVFPLDYYPETNINIFKINQLRYTSKIMSGYDLTAISYSFKKRIMRKILAISVVGSPKKAVIKREKLYKRTKSGSFVANYCGAWGENEIVPASWYGHGAKLMFEGIEVSVPKEYHKWLTQVYGNYMELPPPEKRVTHHYTEVIDLEKSYREYLK